MELVSKVEGWVLAGCTEVHLREEEERWVQMLVGERRWWVSPWKSSLIACLVSEGSLFCWQLQKGHFSEPYLKNERVSLERNKPYKCKICPLFKQRTTRNSLKT